MIKLCAIFVLLWVTSTLFERAEIIVTQRVFLNAKNAKGRHVRKKA